jgi:hypothetical protein
MLCLFFLLFGLLNRLSQSPLLLLGWFAFRSGWGRRLGMLKEINNSNCNNIGLDAIYGNLRVN